MFLQLSDLVCPGNVLNPVLFGTRFSRRNFISTSSHPSWPGSHGTNLNHFAEPFMPYFPPSTNRSLTPRPQTKVPRETLPHQIHRITDNFAPAMFFIAPPGLFRTKVTVFVAVAKGQRQDAPDLEA